MRLIEREIEREGMAGTRAKFDLFISQEQLRREEEIRRRREKGQLKGEDLRGESKTYSNGTLVGNWHEDRLVPRHVPEIIMQETLTSNKKTKLYSKPDTQPRVMGQHIYVSTECVCV